MTTRPRTTMKTLLLLLVVELVLHYTHALSTEAVSRRQWLVGQGTATAAALVTSVLSRPLQPALAAIDATTSSTTKLTNLSNDDFRKILEKDIRENQFLVTGRITRDLYDESCTFQDEIDTYGMDQWIQGTQKLFVGDASTLRLVGPINVSDKQASFQFDEDLVFNIPFRPTVHLTGTLFLQRDANTGLVTSYKEKWDQSVAQVLKSAKL